MAVEPYATPRDLALANAVRLEEQAAAIRRAYESQGGDEQAEAEQVEFVNYTLRWASNKLLDQAPLIHQWGDGNFGYIIDRFARMLRGEL